MGWLRITAGILACLASTNVGCRKCDVCQNIGGPCGYYSLAGREYPMEAEVEKQPEADSSLTPVENMPPQTTPTPLTPKPLPPAAR